MDEMEDRIPEFLKRKPLEKDIPQVWRLLREYDERFKDYFTTEGLNMTHNELAEVLRKCLKENRTFNDVYGMGEIDDGDYI